VYFLYSVLTLLVLVACTPYFLYQALRHNKYVGSLRQRLGYLPVSFNLDGEDSIWVHAVSVGEVLAARPVLAELRKRYPQLRLFLSTTTLSGQQLARQSVPDVDGTFYLPFDWAFTVRRTLRVVRPAAVLMVETEIWPNLLRECRKRGVATMVINGRISPRSFRTLPPGGALVPARARRRQPLLRAGRRGRAAAGRPRRGAPRRSSSPAASSSTRCRARRFRSAGPSGCCASSAWRSIARCWWPAARCAEKKSR
jgi:hypothetical protein